MKEIGPRHRRLLEAWATTIASTSAAEHFDFTSPTRTDALYADLEAFLAEPTEDRFASLWTADNIRDAVYGGPSAVLNHWNGSLEELATLLESVRDAENYQTAWERRFPRFIAPGFRELFGRLDPETRPIVNTSARNGLATFSFGHPHTYARGAAAMEEFKEVYLHEVGHVTAETDHEVGIYDELEQFLHLVATLDEEELRETLGMPDPTYRQFEGWDALQEHGEPIAFSGLTPVLDAFTEAANVDAYEDGSSRDHWGAGHWETWKDDYLSYLDAEVFAEYDPLDLETADVESFIDALSVAEPISNVVPIYLLGGRWQPWDGFKQVSARNPGDAAEVISALLDDDRGPLVDRLRRFNDFYKDTSDSGGERMSLATMLLMIVHPDRYVMYRHRMFSDFFSAFSEYDVPSGFKPGAYVLMNEALQRVRADLDTYVNHEVRMLDVHSLLWVYHRQGPP